MDTPLIDKCFARNLAGLLDGRDNVRLAGLLVIECVGLIVLPLVAVLVPKIYPTAWNPPDQHIIVGLLKIGSIVVLAFHTANNAPEKNYKLISALMAFIVAVYTAYLIFGELDCTSGQFICSWPRYNNMALYINFFAFSYMFIFLWLNIRTLRESDKNDLGRRMFTEAFVFGVNLPSVIAFVVIMAMYWFGLVDHPDLFLNGAIALLIFVSNAAAICIDHFALPFDSAGRDVKSCPA